MLDYWLTKLPKTLIGLIGVIGGLIVFMMMDPPANVCHVQAELFSDSQKDFLTPKKQGNITIPSGYETYNNECRKTNSSGGCLPLFEGLLGLHRELSVVPDGCGGNLISMTPQVLSDSIELLTRLAWGDHPPTRQAMKYGWLDRQELALYCGLKGEFTRLYGNSRWESLREKLLASMPAAENLTRDQVWERSLLSHTCKTSY